MSIVTKGTMLYALLPTIADPKKLEVVQIECPKSFDMGEQSISEIETTSLESSARQYVPGLQEPSTATIEIDPDPTKESHIRIYQLFDPEAGSNAQSYQWVIGWGDGTTEPTINVAGDDFTLPTSRTWCRFEGYISGFPFNFQVNATVTSTISIRRSGNVVWTPKA